MKECIITETNICPNDVISGKICHSCKIPDLDRLKVKWYHHLCLNMPNFKDLGMDEQGELVDCIIREVIEYENPELLDALATMTM